MAEDNSETLYLEDASPKDLTEILDTLSSPDGRGQCLIDVMKMLCEQVNEDDELNMIAVEQDDALSVLRAFVSNCINQTQTAAYFNYTCSHMFGVSAGEMIDIIDQSEQLDIPMVDLILQYQDAMGQELEEEGDEVFNSGEEFDDEISNIVTDVDFGDPN